MRAATLALSLTVSFTVALAGCFGDEGGAVEPDPGFLPDPATGELGLVKVWDALAQPLLVTHDGQRTFVVEQGGTIRVAQDGNLSLWLDISDQLSTGGERGLLGLAFPPDHAETGRFYLAYTRTDGTSVLSRWQADGTADTGSEEVLLTVAQPFGNHNGGHIQFGPDGFLYYGLGDGGAAGDPNGNGQNPATLLGSILRLDVSPSTGYAVPPSNPFVGDPTGADEVWAYGLRNPWRFHFDPATGDLWIGDVGQDCWEEIDLEPAGSAGGRNYGWARFEGRHPYLAPAGAACIEEEIELAGHVFPVAEVRNDGHCSVTGGMVHRGAVEELDGAYVFGDYCSGQLWTLRSEGGSWAMQELMATDLRVSSFGTDPDGALYVVDHQGAVHRFAMQ